MPNTMAHLPHAWGPWRNLGVFAGFSGSQADNVVHLHLKHWLWLL